MDSAVLEARGMEYEVGLRFRPDGPAILGVWSKPETAEQVFMEWLGLYGRDGTVLTLNATTGSAVTSVKSWTYAGGLQVTGAA
ncbi:hypothetical protein EF919_37820 [Streptomyces sp. WAC02707]|uniref:hypothetical protein n=1 Tax=Streptomyces sp. WAC02707 TaxID=2487417 RepID=UPI000F7824B5|nr:hypothetical protein [Streptomyces sp. WAC02707]RSS85677.1 hypothetical protein EF919_37820 [Streptomyces sp. WAC02707]